MGWGNFLIIGEKEYFIRDEPLLSYWDTIQNKPSISGLSSCPLDKGYYAKWELNSGNLLLLDFYSTANILSPVTYNFQDYFGNKNQPFLARWFSGDLRIGEGETIYFDHHFGATYEYYFILTFSKGTLINTKMEDTIL